MGMAWGRTLLTRKRKARVGRTSPINPATLDWPVLGILPAFTSWYIFVCMSFPIYLRTCSYCFTFIPTAGSFIYLFGLVNRCMLLFQNRSTMCLDLNSMYNIHSNCTFIFISVFFSGPFAFS